jgi:hypothetical protein
MRLIIAFVAAVLAPTIALVLWYLYGQFQVFDSGDPYIWVRTRGFFVICLLISLAHVVVLGIPTYLVLRWCDALRWWSTFLSGFVLGVIPFGVLSWPLRYASPGSSATVDGVETMVNGVPTTAGWLQYLGGVSFFGACGLFAAMVFWVVWGMGPNYSFKPKPLRGSA